MAGDSVMKQWVDSRVLAGALMAWCLSGLAMAGADFALPDLHGKVHHLSDYRGKWVLVNYWATWCPPCREELPELEVLHNAEGKGPVVLGVNLEDIDKGALSAFVDEQFLSYPILMAGARPAREQLLGPIHGLPTSYLISPEGKVVARQVGPVTARGIEDFIEHYEEQASAERTPRG